MKLLLTSVLSVLLLTPTFAQKPQHYITADGGVGISRFNYRLDILNSDLTSDVAYYAGLSYEFQFNEHLSARARIGYALVSMHGDRTYRTPDGESLDASIREFHVGNDAMLGARYWIGKNINVGFGAGLSFRSLYAYGWDIELKEDSNDPAISSGVFQNPYSERQNNAGYYIESLSRFDLHDHFHMTCGVQWEHYVLEFDSPVMESSYALSGMIGFGFNF